MTKEEFINKACKWLEENTAEIRDYTNDTEGIPSVESIQILTKQEFINNFKKAMEE